MPAQLIYKDIAMVTSFIGHRLSVATIRSEVEAPIFLVPNFNPD